MSRAETIFRSAEQAIELEKDGSVRVEVEAADFNLPDGVDVMHGLKIEWRMQGEAPRQAQGTLQRLANGRALLTAEPCPDA